MTTIRSTGSTGPIVPPHAPAAPAAAAKPAAAPAARDQHVASGHAAPAVDHQAAPPAAPRLSASAIFGATGPNGVHLERVGDHELFKDKHGKPFAEFKLEGRDLVLNILDAHHPDAGWLMEAGKSLSSMFKLEVNGHPSH